MTTPTDTAKLADEIEALAKKHREAADYVKSTPRDCRIPFDKMMELESTERAITRACMEKSATIIAALRELEAVKAREAKLREIMGRMVNYGLIYFDRKPSPPDIFGHLMKALDDARAAHGGAG